MGRGRRVAILGFIRQHTKDQGYEPSVTTICERLDMPRATLMWHLISLREQGFVRFDTKDVSQTLRVTRKRAEVQ